jgi:hypothetical protein
VPPADLVGDYRVVFIPDCLSSVWREVENGKLVEGRDESGGAASRVTRAAMRPVGMSISGSFRSCPAA